MSITHLKSLDELNGILGKGDLTVVDFHASWCGPCHTIAPTYEALAKEHPNVHFLKCDVDDLTNVAAEYQISAMPTFLFFQGADKVDQVRGADPNGLRNALKKHAPAVSKFPGQGNTLGGS